MDDSSVFTKNILIKHHDKWRGDYYLTDKLIFTTNRTNAAFFSFNKRDNTSILNGDRISIHSGNKILIIDDSGNPALVTSDNIRSETDIFIITDNENNTEPVSYEKNIFIISDNFNKTALKYEWGMDITSDNSGYLPKSNPTIINTSYDIIPNSSQFLFMFERGDIPITRTTQTNKVQVCHNNKLNIVDGYKGVAIIVLLMIILMLCIIINRQQ